MRFFIHQLILILILILITYRFRQIHRCRTHIQCFCKSTITFDDQTLTIAFNLAFRKILQNLLITRHSNQTLLHFASTTTRTVNHDIKHTGCGWTRFTGMTRCLASMLTELSLLSTRLATTMLGMLLCQTRSLMAMTRTLMSTGKWLSTQTVAENLLTIARHTLDQCMTSLTHTFGELTARRTRTKMAFMIGVAMTARTKNTAWTIAYRRWCSTDQRRVENLLSASTCNGC